MIPQIALIACTIFVIFLLWLERKQAPGISMVTWIPTLWLLLINSKPLGVWFDMEREDMESGSSLDRVFLILLLSMGLIIILKRQINWVQVLRENIWLVLLISYMLISVLWSNMPIVSFKRWIREIVAVMMALIVLTERSPSRALQSIFRRTIYILIPYSYILIHYFSHLGRMYGRWSGEVIWVGVTLHKNGLGKLCIFAIFYLIWMIYRRWQKREITAYWYQTYFEVFLLFLALWLFGGPEHSLTYSSTSTATLFIGLMCFAGLLWIKRWGKLPRESILIVILAFIIVYGTATPFLGKLSIIDLSSTLGREETLTGRTIIWATLIPFALNQPLFGHGFGGFWTDAMRDLTSSHAHNGYLDVLLDTGFFGLVLVSLFILSCTRKGYNLLMIDFDWGNFFLCVLFMLVICNITESTLSSLSSQLPATITILSIVFSHKIEKISLISQSLKSLRT